MKKIRLFLVAMLMCVVTNGMAQAKYTPDTQRDYYLYSYIEVRWANKANGGTMLCNTDVSWRKWTTAFFYYEK